MLIRQFYAIRQTSSVADYIERFELIFNHLASYSDSIHPYYHLTRFVEGLRADIRAVVMVQRPHDLDTARSLALLQEEVAECTSAGFSNNSSQRTTAVAPRSGTPLPLPLPHVCAGPPPPLHNIVATDRPGTEAARAHDSNKNDPSKIKALREYRRARGLCFKCGERWGHDHSCLMTVQLHVVEELLELFGINTMYDDPGSASSEPAAETAMAISRHALTGSVAPKAFQLHAWIQGQEVLMLVDSGSSTSFPDQ